MPSTATWSEMRCVPWSDETGYAVQIPLYFTSIAVSGWLNPVPLQQKTQERKHCARISALSAWILNSHLTRVSFLLLPNGSTTRWALQQQRAIVLLSLSWNRCVTSRGGRKGPSTAAWVAQIHLAGRNLDSISNLMAPSSLLFLGWILVSVYITHGICVRSENCH